MYVCMCVSMCMCVNDGAILFVYLTTYTFILYNLILTNDIYGELSQICKEL